jgi:hypothetical protein
VLPLRCKKPPRYLFHCARYHGRYQQTCLYCTLTCSPTSPLIHHISLHTKPSFSLSCSTRHKPALPTFQNNFFFFFAPSGTCLLHCLFTCVHQFLASVITIGIMSEPDQCIICLDPLPRPSSSTQSNEAAVDTASAPIAEAAEGDSNYLNIVAALDGCDHIIHDACIRSWAQKTNTCPICRKPFHSVRVYNGLDGKFSYCYCYYCYCPSVCRAPPQLHSTKC